MATQDRLDEIEEILEKNTWLAIGEAKWLIAEIKRLRNDLEMVKRGEYPKP